jgi:aspartyl-tRNA(Asn)/glutamyl-tRNA(Gln) amidotransferase subunit B
VKKLNEVLQDWEAVIGLEIHTELTALDTKMFCNCRLSHDDEPNANVCPVCLGLPGALPVPNKRAIQSIVKAGLATNCQIMRHSMFYRKHYFYPDMAKNFQTTQGPVAFCMHGHLDLEVTGRGAAERPECAFGEAEAASLASASANAVGLSTAMTEHLPEGKASSQGTYDTANLAIPVRAEDGSYTVPIRILRIHMEEDAAKMVHVGGEEGRIGGATESLIDYNRCGTPLIELVTEPDLRTPEEARLFMEKLRRVFLTLGISDCSMEKGSMRCDGNVSLRRRGETRLGTKTELKNLNSFKALHDGLEYEICRQAEVLEEGGIIYQETRHWEPSRKRTVVMRVKETADDYRLFPDPDLAPFDLTDEFIAGCEAEIPELPDAKRDRYVESFGLKHADAAQLAGDPAVASFFEEVAAQVEPKVVPTVANVMVNLAPAYDALTTAQVASISSLLAEDAIAFAQAREVLEAVNGTGEDPAKVVDERGMRQTTDTGALEPIVDEVLARCTDQAQQYRDGNTKVIGFLVGQCMKASKGSGNPKLFNQLLAEKLS